MSVILRAAQEHRAAVRPIAAITFPRAGLRCCTVLGMAAVALFGCAPAKPPILAPQAAVAPGGPAYATVATVRPIPAFAAAGGGGQAAILAAMSIPQSAMGTSGASSEIIVRTDGGETLSVVEPDSAGLALGERVIVVRGGLLRLVPSSPRS
jgi:hypothetical protein